MSYTWNLPTKVFFGPGSLKKLVKTKMPGRKALLLISNGTSARKNGSLASVENQLKDSGVEVALFAKIPPNPTTDVLDAGAAFCREQNCDFVIGLGGGSVLDAATIIAAIAPQQTGGVWDYVKGGTGGGLKLAQKPLPYIAITTSAGTGSEVDCWGVVTNPSTHEKIGFQGSYAALAIVDPELMLSVPPEFTAYQGFDALFHSIEGYISRYTNEAAELFELKAIANIAGYLPRAVADGSDLEARTQVAFANTLSGYSMEVSTCVSQHAMEHAMSGCHEALPHGAGLIMLSLAYFTVWIEKKACDERFVAMAKALGKKDAACPGDFIDALKKLELDCGVAELKMSSYGITPAEFPDLCANAKSSMAGLFKCDRFKMSDEEVISIYAKSYR